MKKRSAGGQWNEKNSKFLMPATYATVVGNLNVQSGDLNLHSSLKKQNSSMNNLPMSPKSQQAYARRHKSKNTTGFTDQ